MNELIKLKENNSSGHLWGSRDVRDICDICDICDTTRGFVTNVTNVTNVRSAPRVPLSAPKRAHSANTQHRALKTHASPALAVWRSVRPSPCCLDTAPLQAPSASAPPIRQLSARFAMLLRQRPAQSGTPTGCPAACDGAPACAQHLMDICGKTRVAGCLV